MSDRISVEISNGVADVRLTRADKMNALDDAMFEAIVETGERMKTEKGVRAVVISGDGRAFCAGLDMGNFGKMAGSADGASAPSQKRSALATRTHGIANRPQYAAWVWREVPVPVIAAVHGVAFGGGFQVCLGADMRYVAPDTKMSVMEIKWGLVPDMSGTQLMRNLAREDIVRELSYTGRIFSGEEALAYGFATRLSDDPRALALETAAEIAGRNPDAIRANKRIFNAAPYLEAAQGLQMESDEQDEIIGTPNQIEAIMSTMEKRAGNYNDG
jgi:enoyl-CoA hydratase/carnithine racemase